jgi:hypothetical protein
VQLERLNLALRRRTPWEALDLGLVMLRRFYGPVFRAWFATVLPVLLLLTVLLWQWPTVAILVAWWLKPLYDRVLLKVFAEAAFDAPPTVRNVWRALPGLLRHSGLLGALTVRRFNMHRSFDLPVWQLEGQRGKAGRARLRVLGRKTAGHAFWLTFVCIHFVVIFEFGSIALLEIARPAGTPHVMDLAEFFSGEPELWQSIIYNLAWVAAESIVEPFFVAAGFCLYLNRRSDLEGWDIEVAFRRMAERHAQATPLAPTVGKSSRLRRGAASGLLVVGLTALLAGPGEVFAEAGSCPAPDEAEQGMAAQATGQPAIPGRRPPGAVSRATKTLLADPVFGREVNDTQWQYKAKEETEKRETPWWAKKLAEIAELLAIGARGLIYVLILISVAVLLVVLYRYRHLVLREGVAPRGLPTTLFGLDLRPESLPDDVAASALAEVDRGHYAAALSLLYRATLVELVRRRQIELRPGDTEDSCLRRAAGRIDNEAAAYFAQLLDAWKRTAYAGQPPAAQSARQLCLGWQRHFAPAGSAA